jgi:hypothetical protein
MKLTEAIRIARIVLHEIAKSDYKLELDQHGCIHRAYGILAKYHHLMESLEKEIDDLEKELKI